MEQSTLDNQLRECVSCAEGEEIGQLLLMSCDQHFFHKTCLVELFERIMTTPDGEDLFPPNCCGVKHPILMEQVQDAFTIDFIERWQAKELEYLTPKPLRVHCAKPECGRFIPVDEHQEDHVKTVAICSSCNTSTCTGCKQLREDDRHQCPLDRDVAAAMEYRPDYRVKRCPGCSVFVQHTDACNHMTCTNCTHEFCFICLEPYGDSEGRCNCPIYGDPLYDADGYDADGFHRDTGLDREGYGRRGYNRAGVNRAGEQRPTDTNIRSRVPERVRWLQEQARIRQQEEQRLHQAIIDLEDGIIQQNDFGLDNDEAWHMLDEDDDNPNGDDFVDEDDFRDDEDLQNENGPENGDDGDIDGHADEHDHNDLPDAAWGVPIDGDDNERIINNQHQQDIPFTAPAPLPPALPPTEAQIDCPHTWQFRHVGRRCRLCLWESDIFHMTCERCHLDVCRDCSHNFQHNLQRFWPRAESYGVDILHEIYEAAYAEANPFEGGGFAIDVMLEEAERVYRERHPFENEGFGIDLMHQEAEAQYREKHPFEHEGFAIDILHRQAEAEYALAQFEKGHLPDVLSGRVTRSGVQRMTRARCDRPFDVVRVDERIKSSIDRTTDLNLHGLGGLIEQLGRTLAGFEPLVALFVLVALSILESVLSGS